MACSTSGSWWNARERSIMWGVLAHTCIPKWRSLDLWTGLIVAEGARAGFCSSSLAGLFAVLHTLMTCWLYEFSCCSNIWKITINCARRQNCERRICCNYRLAEIMIRDKIRNYAVSNPNSMYGSAATWGARGRAVTIICQYFVVVTDISVSWKLKPN